MILFVQMHSLNMDKYAILYEKPRGIKDAGAHLDLDREMAILITLLIIFGRDQLV